MNEEENKLLTSNQNSNNNNFNSNAEIRGDNIAHSHSHSFHYENDLQRTIETAKMEASKNFLVVNQSYLKLRIVISIIFLIGFLFISNNSSKLNDFFNISGIKIFTFEATQIFQNYFKKHIGWKYSLFIFSSISVDFLSIFSFIMFVFFSKSFRFVFAIILYCLLLLFFQNIFIFSDNNTSLWSYPGFPSLIISYSKTESYYYCGAIGLSVICAFEFLKYNYQIMMIYCYCSVLLQSSILIIIRNHYLIDIITGIIVAHYCFLISEIFINYIEGKIHENFDEEKTLIVY